jgi:hypothetical protein
VALGNWLSRHEWAVCGLVAFCYLYFFQPAATNTISRFDMVEALAHGTPIIDSRASNTIDVSYFNGHFYSPRSLGLSLLAVPAYWVARGVAAVTQGQGGLTPQIAALTLLTVTPVAVVGTVICLRFVRRLRPALAGTPYPLVVASALALGTLYYPFAASFYSHAFAGALDLIGFYLLYRAKSSARPARLVLVAGLLVGFAVISEYPSAVTALALTCYIWVVLPGEWARARPIAWSPTGEGLQMALLFVAAMAPSALLLAGYNWWAFGNPLHLSYEFVAGQQFAGQHTGFFGIGLPSLDGLWQLLVWPRGLLVNSPFLIFVPLGFYRWLRTPRRPPAEALVCLAVVVAYPLLISSYYLPMAGENQPGPRLLVPMLPFACLALAWVVDDARRWLRATFAALLAFSIALSFLWVALGGREYHTYRTYPARALFLPLLQTGLVASDNHGATPGNLASLLHSPQVVSLYIGLLPLALWAGYLIYVLVSGREASAVSEHAL